MSRCVDLQGDSGADLGAGMDKLQFIVKHYAEEVSYTALNWLEKNRGKLHADLTTLLAASESPLLQSVGAEEDTTVATSKRPTVSGKFRMSLRQLSAARPARPLRRNFGVIEAPLSIFCISFW